MPHVCILGAGLAGLTAAIELQRLGAAVTIVDAADAPGGRVRTDNLDGRLVDRGFQVLLDAYPETRRLLDYHQLNLKPFYPGALVRHDGAFHRVADPWRKPVDAARGFLSPVATLADKARLLKLGLAIKSADQDDLFRSHDQRTIDLLHDANLSEIAVQRFFKPFFGGVFFDRSLQTSSRMFRFTFKMFASGRACVPARGMQRIPDQLVARLDKAAFRLNEPAERVEPGRVALASGETIDADAVLLATDMDSAATLLADTQHAAGLDAETRRGWNSTRTVVFAADEPPVGEPILLLDGDGAGPINHVAVMSNVSPHYAPDGDALIYCNTAERPLLDGDDFLEQVRNQMADWFGDAATLWKHLDTVEVERALPRSLPGSLDPDAKQPRLDDRLFLAGDYRHDPSINGAMASGRRAAAAVAAVDHA